MDTYLRRLTSVALLAVGALVVGCTAPAITPSPATSPTSPPIASRSPSGSTPAPTLEPSSTAAEVDVVIYLTAVDPDGPGYLVPVLRRVPDRGSPIAEALEALLAGPTADEREGIDTGRRGFQPLTTAIPAGTTLRAVSYGAGRAVLVDFSGAFLGDSENPVSVAMREAQIVYTIFAAPWPSAFGDQPVAGVGVSVDGTAIDVIEGHEGSIVPGGRVSWRHFYDQLPPILVDHPVWGSTVTPTLYVSGLAQLVTDSFRVAVVDGDAGTIVVERALTAPRPGAWMPPGGDVFATTLDLPRASGDLRLRAWTEESSGIANQIEIPLR